ncbi:MAG: hypothetical protein HQM13_20685 [SAR324 cluster bacterium]|nr:hypothetical protein [SAR324 cluster bacterium]
MKPPFNLIRVFSIVSLISIILLTLVVSWLLSSNLKKQLLERDKQLTISTFIPEVLEELDDLEISFESAPLNPEFTTEMEEVISEINGGMGLDMIKTSGEVIWSTYPEKIGAIRRDPRFLQTSRGSISIEIQEELLETDKAYLSSYIPIIRNHEVLGVFEVHRQDPELLKQIQSVRKAVYLYSFLYGAGLYVVMMLIIVPTSRILDKQHRQLLEAQEQLIEKERLSAIGEVCGAVAHGLKNPIASVRAAVQLLAVRKIAEERRNKIVSDILHEVDRLTKRLSDLLDFIRPFKPDLQYVKLHDVLTNAVRSLSWKAEKDNIQFEFNDSETVINAYLDAALIEEAVLIVLSNAMDASKSGDTIYCSVEYQKDRKVIVVKDEGRGIPSEILPQIFEQFFTTRSQGVGLGLSLCKKIMTLHQGEVVIESKADHGTTVMLRFPQ